ncbi:hypothetical protein M885DRAFT_110899 [Pelagophyceae sp. CCMP2097]|nr:hypothetical protein M885DRAFT_110899 [Pelagophyceae sp. CCMP2097]
MASRRRFETAFETVPFDGTKARRSRYRVRGPGHLGIPRYITALLEDPSTFRKLVSPPRLCALAVALPSAHLLWVYSLARVCDLSWGNRVGIDVLFRAASLGGVRRSTTSRVLRSLGLLPSPKKQRQASPLQPPPESPPSRVAQSSRFLGRAISPTLRRSDTERPSPRLGKSAIEKPQSDAGKGLFFKFAGQEGHGAADEDAGDEYGVGLTDLDAAVDENALEKADKGAEESPKKTKHDEEDLAQARWLYDQTSKWAVPNRVVGTRAVPEPPKSGGFWDAETTCGRGGIPYGIWAPCPGPWIAKRTGPCSLAANCKASARSLARPLFSVLASLARFLARAMTGPLQGSSHGPRALCTALFCGLWQPLVRSEGGPLMRSPRTGPCIRMPCPRSRETLARAPKRPLAVARHLVEGSSHGPWEPPGRSPAMHESLRGPSWK